MPPPPPPSAGPPPPPSYQPYGAPAAGGWNPKDLTTILWSGILSIICCAPLGIYAIIKGNEIKQKAAASGVEVPSNATIGYICGIIGCVLWGLAIVYRVVL